MCDHVTRHEKQEDGVDPRPIKEIRGVPQEYFPLRVQPHAIGALRESKRGTTSPPSTHRLNPGLGEVPTHRQKTVPNY